MRFFRPAVLILCMTPFPAFAHGGVGHGFAAGLVHPFSGADHLLALLGLGLWLGLSGVRHAPAAIGAFIAALAGGIALGASGIHVPMVEPGILSSVLVLGLLAATATRLPAAAVILLPALFAMFHGHAHGSEHADGAMPTYALGLLAASALLAIASYGAGVVMRGPRLRFIGRMT